MSLKHDVLHTKSVYRKCLLLPRPIWLIIKGSEMASFNGRFLKIKGLMNKMFSNLSFAIHIWVIDAACPRSHVGPMMTTSTHDILILKQSLTLLLLQLINTVLASDIPDSKLQWNGNIVILATFSSLSAPEVFILTTSGAVCDESFVKMSFRFQCMWSYLQQWLSWISLPVVLYCQWNLGAVANWLH